MENLTNKLGGRFNLAVLVQKRLRELAQSGLKLHGPHNYHSLMEMVLDEVLENKVQITESKTTEKTD